MKSQYCVGESFFRYDPEQMQSFTTMFKDSKNEIMERGAKELKNAIQKGKKYQGDLQKQERFSCINLAYKFFS